MHVSEATRVEIRNFFYWPKRRQGFTKEMFLLFSIQPNLFRQAVRTVSYPKYPGTPRYPRRQQSTIG